MQNSHEEVGCYTGLVVGIDINQWGINPNCSLVKGYKSANGSGCHLLHSDCNRLSVIGIQSRSCTLYINI